MTNERREIAVRIRGLREASERSCREVASRTGVPPETYMRYETGAEDVPMSYLSRLAAFYQVEVTALLTGGDAHARVFHVTRKGGGPVVERRHAYHYEALGARFAGKTMEPFIVTVGPALDTPHLNTHPGQEFNYVLSGRLRLSVGGHETVLAPGDSIYFDASVPHGMRAEEGAEATFLAVITA